MTLSDVFSGIAILISLYSIYASRKIKTLTDVTNELKRQSDHVEATLELQKRLYAPSVQPVFRFITTKSGGVSFDIYVKNIGQGAHYFRAKLIEGMEYGSLYCGYNNKSVYSNDVPNLVFTWRVDGQKTFVSGNITIRLTYSDGSGLYFEQILKMVEYQCEISYPLQIEKPERN